jgi:hypothetical protein
MPFIPGMSISIITRFAEAAETLPFASLVLVDDPINLISSSTDSSA